MTLVYDFFEMIADYKTIKTLDDLGDALDRDLGWRKKEMTALKFLLANSKETPQKEIITKSSIAIFYSHWEGHIKFCTKAYLTYLNAQNLSCDSIKDSLFLLFLSSQFDNTNNIALHNINNSKKLLSLIRNRSSQTLKISIEKLIKTSNLNYEELNRYLQYLDIQTDFYQTKAQLLNQSLLPPRNDIAHGNYISFEHAQRTWELYEEHIISMISEFSDLVKEAAEKENHFHNGMPLIASTVK